MSTVQLRLGDMFDGPSDMIVLPCSTAGTVTPFVAEKLMHFNIPYPQVGMDLGNVQIEPFVGGENIAQFVAFATSVNRSTSSAEAIRRIGIRLGESTLKGHTIRHIAAPLLGTGAGALQSELVVEALREGFKSTAHANAKLVINVLRTDVYERIQNLNHVKTTAIPPDQNNNAQKPLRVFISYAHSNEEHKQWVQTLARFLRENGIDARLDAWHLRRGMDLPQFMTNELALAERVILVSDEKFAEKANGRVGGVGWETMIIQGDLSKLPPDSIKYLVIVRSNNIDTGLPLYLKTKFIIHWPDATVDADNRHLLLKEMFDQVIVPAIGPSPVFI